MPHGSGYDDDDVETEPNSLISGSARKRKRMLEDMVEISNKPNQKRSELVSTVKSLVAFGLSQNAFTRPPIRSYAIISEMNALMEKLNELRKIDDDSELTKKSISLTEAALRETHSLCEDMMRTIS